MSKILIVEDHPMNRMLLRDLLEHHGHQVVEARDVAEAHRALDEAVGPDLVLLDIQIPGGGGVAVLRTIREREALCKLPVIAVTALAMTGDRARFLALGFDGYISKPISTEEFRRSVEAFLVRSAAG